MLRHPVRRLLLVLLTAVNVVLFADTALARDEDPPYQGRCDVCFAGPVLFACCVAFECIPLMCNCNATSQCSTGGET